MMHEARGAAGGQARHDEIDGTTKVGKTKRERGAGAHRAHEGALVWLWERRKGPGKRSGAEVALGRGEATGK